VSAGDTRRATLHKRRQRSLYSQAPFRVSCGWPWPAGATSDRLVGILEMCPGVDSQNELGPRPQHIPARRTRAANTRRPPGTPASAVFHRSSFSAACRSGPRSLAAIATTPGSIRVTSRPASFLL
jgi:hypothetical protein